MTSSLDVAGLVPAVAAAVQAAAVVVQMYWGRRQRTAETIQKPADLEAVRSRRNSSQAVLVQVRVCPHVADEVAVSVCLGGSAAGMELEPSKEDGPW
ncbi:hypothetical protein [Streptomyces clavifer]|uniref:hypothetical protein n=1 Tax=Streptomyces clavifer TaxID=68188 RepID=UPI002E821114|nr:hypothetical protein [Streptomyces clavifer]WRY80026.1 hypothetical protein OG388_01675 [Streptomyces clavifer]WRY86292.1 hypothetical protein OG388_36320 [Streptomyces clavifer]WUC32350.1 hypothetical protein OG927_33765 [Streptomyces clavifer]